MAETLKLGNGIWATKENSLLSYNDENGNYKPLPFDFTRASSATVVNKAGLIETVGTGTPRIDFLGNTNGALLLEPQRTNLVTYSNDFSNAYWTKSGASVTSGFTSPDGTDNAFKLVESNSSAVHYIKTPNITVSNSTNHTMSFFAKKGERNIAVRDGSSDSFVSIDLTNNLVLDSLGLSTSIELISSGWYKITVSYLSTSTICAFQLITLSPTYTSGSPWSSYQGDGTSGVYIYGAQLEQSSYPTSYIPTQGSTVTRVQEGSFIINLDTKNIITNSGSWTAFFELELLGNEPPVDKIQLSDNSNNPRAYLYATSAGVSGTGWSGGAVLSMNTNNKIIYRGNSTQNISFFENGINEATFSSASNPITFNRLNLYGANGAFKIKQIQLFKTALSDAECIALTSL